MHIILGNRITNPTWHLCGISLSTPILAPEAGRSLPEEFPGPVHLSAGHSPDSARHVGRWMDVHKGQPGSTACSSVRVQQARSKERCCIPGQRSSLLATMWMSHSVWVHNSAGRALVRGHRVLILLICVCTLELWSHKQELSRTAEVLGHLTQASPALASV
jgi:hypothetical protein